MAARVGRRREEWGNGGRGRGRVLRGRSMQGGSHGAGCDGKEGIHYFDLLCTNKLVLPVLPGVATMVVPLSGAPSADGPAPAVAPGSSGRRGSSFGSLGSMNVVVLAVWSMKNVFPFLSLLLSHPGGSSLSLQANALTRATRSRLCWYRSKADRSRRTRDSMWRTEDRFRRSAEGWSSC